MNLFWGISDHIQTEYDERKTAAAAAYLLSRAGGRMEFIRLIKLLYLADREAWGQYERPITGDSYVSMDNGPVLSRTYDLLKPDAPSGPWSATIERTGNDARLRVEPDLGPLSEAEVDILAETNDRFSAVPTWGTNGLIDRLHRILPEWEYPKGTSKPISPEAILSKIGKADRIKAVRKELEEIAEFRRLVGSG
ncbi:MAG: Panacea domain-containing protein [Gemmatimonadaceae bacterium]